MRHSTQRDVSKRSIIESVSQLELCAIVAVRACLCLSIYHTRCTKSKHQEMANHDGAHCICCISSNTLVDLVGMQEFQCAELTSDTEQERLFKFDF